MKKELQLKYEAPNAILFSFVRGRVVRAEAEVGQETKGTSPKREVQHQKIYQFSVKDLHDLKFQQRCPCQNKNKILKDISIFQHHPSPNRQSKSIKPDQKNSISLNFLSEQTYKHTQEEAICRLIN